MPVGEGLTLPAALQSLRHFLCENAISLYTREAFVWFSPYYLVLPLLIVGDDVLGVPRAFKERPYGFDCCLNIRL